MTTSQYQKQLWKLLITRLDSMKATTPKGLEFDVKLEQPLNGQFIDEVVTFSLTRKKCILLNRRVSCRDFSNSDKGQKLRGVLNEELNFVSGQFVKQRGQNLILETISTPEKPFNQATSPHGFNKILGA
ncbi:hypothetical protein F9L16_23600 [Agarivorans sp. B2Z047]|uniref:hypothetical protein n=1 Tax=Agarivorans sp. B2Z047 TaxID=2652721 RepID=UPI00128C5809|nr:hypothetical protein [Agarivorans sp. B2Z047]MPW31943.1 hypothetical protein [Agarivorans sp. B2Z047]UQN41912.1 hypothetical protein LQZ07_19350 [Agarivorans sp. B2Z047]